MKLNLKKLKAKSLSNTEIKKTLGNSTTIYAYPQLKQFRNLEDAFQGKDSITLLYLQTPNYGHWCCLNKINDNLVEFFDPYGYVIDSELKWVNKKTRKELNQECPLLSKLLIKSKYKLSYNEHQFQKLKEGVNTCGRHCIVRTLFNFASLKRYKQMFDSAKKLGDPDDIVTILTYDI